MDSKELLKCLTKEEYTREIKKEEVAIISDALVRCYGTPQELIERIQRKNGQETEVIDTLFYRVPKTHSYRGISEFLQNDRSAFQYLVEIIPKVRELFPKYAQILNELDNYIRAEELRLSRDDKLNELMSHTYARMKKHEKLQREFEADLKKNERKTIKEINENIEKVKATQDGIQSRFVSIIGMFSSVIFALFGGLNMLSAVVTGIQSVKDTSQILLLISMLCFLFMSLYTLVIVILFFIGRVASIDGSLFPKVSFGSLFSRAPFLRGSVLSLSKTIIIILMVVSVITFSGSIGWSKPVTASKNEQILQRCLDYDLKKINEIILRSDNEKATSTNDDAAIEKICAKYEREKTEEKTKLSANEKEIKKT